MVSQLIPTLIPPSHHRRRSLFDVENHPLRFSSSRFGDRKIICQYTCGLKFKGKQRKLKERRSCEFLGWRNQLIQQSATLIDVRNSPRRFSSSRFGDRKIIYQYASLIGSHPTSSRTIHIIPYAPSGTIPILH
jgi:hypothetical protein